MKIFVETAEKNVAKTGCVFLKINCVCADKTKKLLYLWEEIELFEQCFLAGQKIFECELSDDVNFQKLLTFQATSGDVNEFYDFIYPSDEYANNVFQSMRARITDSFYSLIVNEIFSMTGPNGQTLDKIFTVIPAAKTYHHDFRYGLLKHTEEVMSYVAGVNAGDDRHYIDSFGKERALYMSNWYMRDYFGENKLLNPCIWVAAVLVAVMLIVVVGGAI